MTTHKQRLSIETPMVADGKPSWHYNPDVLDMTASTRVPARVIKSYAGEKENVFTARRAFAENFLTGVGYSEVVVNGVRARTLNEIYEAEMNGGGIKPTDLLEAVHNAIHELHVSQESDKLEVAC